MLGADRPCSRQRGAALLLALLIALTLSLTFFFKTANTGRNSYAREQATAEALAQAKAALIGYSATYRDTHPDQGFGYLLCPDLDNDGDAEGVCGNKGETMVGRLPYKTLGLPDLRTADGECLWYVVSGGHKNNPKTAPLNWDTPGQIAVEDISGAALIAPEDDNGGAVAAIIAPGPPLPGQGRPGGNSRCNGDTSNSIAAYLDGNYAAATAATLTIAAGLPGSTINNDRVAWISARELFAPVAKRRDLLGPLLAQLTSCLNLTGAKHIPAVNKVAAGNAKWVSSAAGVDEVMKTLGTGVCPQTLTDSTAWKNWNDHFRYIVCSDPSTKCIQVSNGVSCSGAILFGGRMTGGKPRSGAEKLSLTNYFDSGNANTLSTAASALSGSTLYDGTNPDSDVAICLQPAP